MNGLDRSDRFRRIAARQRTWLVENDGWVLADSGLPGEDRNSGAQPDDLGCSAALYRWSPDRSSPDTRTNWPDDPGALDRRSPGASGRCRGEEGISLDPGHLDTAWSCATRWRCRSKVQGEIQGAWWWCSPSPTACCWSPMRRLGRLLFTTLALAFGLAAGHCGGSPPGCRDGCDGSAVPSVMPCRTNRGRRSPLPLRTTAMSWASWRATTRSPAAGRSRLQPVPANPGRQALA